MPRHDKCRRDHPGRGLMYGSTSTRIRRDRRGKPVGIGAREHDPPPGGVALDTTPLTPRASEAFTPEELDARIARLRQLAEQRRPLR